MSVHWTSASIEAEGVQERDFALDHREASIAGVAWLPPAAPPEGLVLVGHGYTTHKRCAYHVPVARRLASEHGFAAAAIDAPCHGDRAPDAADAEQVAEAYLAYWRANGGAAIAEELVAASEGLATLPEIGPVPLGYWGLSLGTQYGLEYLATSDSVRAAVLGLFGLVGPRIDRSASRVRCPVRFIRQLDDELHSADSAQRLFDRLGSADKTIDSSPGAHAAVPPDVLDSALVFLTSTLRACA